MNWPDDANHTKKPRYSAETGNKLLHNKNIAFENLENDYLKLKEQLAQVSQERDDVTNKLRGETTRLTSLERELLRGKEELATKDNDRANLEAELAQASSKCKEAEQEQKFLQQQLNDLSARQAAGDQRSNKILDLEKKVRALQAENARLSNIPERPASRTSSIPVPKPRRPSDSKSPRLEEDLRTCRAELAEEKAKVKRIEAKMKKAEADAMQLQNEKTADARKSKDRIGELQASLQEAKEEVDLLRLEIQANNRRSDSSAAIQKLERDRESALEQLKTAKEDKAELEKRLARRNAQCEALQEKLDDCLYPPDNEALQQELADAKEEASRAKEELRLFKENAEDLANRRDSLLDTRYELQDRDRKIQSLEEKLRRRESSVADIETQTKRIEQLIHEKENVKDDLRRAQQHSRYVDSQLSFRQQELTHAQTQVKELETALSKARALNNQQQELYAEVVKSCNVAEGRVEEVERELAEIRDEVANRSTMSEAQERNRQWKQALDRVGELERQLAEMDEGPSTPKASTTPLPPVLTFADESERDAVASLVIRLGRVREERDRLRDSVEFLNLELRAKEVTFERQKEAQRSRLLRTLQSAEQDIAHLRHDLTLCEQRLSASQQESSVAAKSWTANLNRTNSISTAALVALQHAHYQLETSTPLTENVAPVNVQVENELQESMKAIQDLKALLEKRDASLIELNNQYSDLNRDAREKGRSLQDLQDKLEELEEARHKLEDLLAEQNGNVRALERELDARGMEYQRLEEAHTIAREELYEARQEADQLRNNHMTELGQENPEVKETLERHIDELDARIVRRNEQIGIQQNDIRRLDMNLRIAESTVDELRTEVDELRRQVGWLEDDASNVRQERNSAQKELETARHELDFIQGSIGKHDAVSRASEQAREVEIATLVEIISTSCVQVRLTTSALDDANMKVDELQSLLDSLPEGQMNSAQSENLSQELEDARKTIETLSNSHQQDSQRLLDYSQKTEQLETALQDALSRGNTLAEQMGRASELARDEVEERILSLEEQIETMSGEVESLEERLGEAQQQIEVVLSQNGDLTNQIYELETTAETASKEHQEKVDELEATVQRLQDEVQDSKANQSTNQASLQELNKLKEELSIAQTAAKNAEELKSRVETLQKEKTALTEQIGQLSSSINERKMELDTLLRRVAEVDALKEEILRKSEDVQQAEATRSQLEQELALVRSEMQQTQQQLSDKSTSLQQCQNALADASQQMNTLRSNLASLEASSAKLEHELYEAQQAASAAASTTVRDAERDARIIQLESLIATIKEENQELERVLTHKTQEIDDHDDRHIEMLRERKKLVAKVDSLNRKIRMMQKQLDGVSPSEDVPLSESVTGSVTVAVSQTAPTHSVQPLSSNLSTPLPAPPNYLQPQPSSGSTRSSTTSRRSPAPIPPPVYEQVESITLTRALSSSAPSAPLISAVAVSTPIRAMPNSASLPPSQAPHILAQQVTPPHQAVSPPSQASSSRKRRLPDDFDPSPEAQLPAMPVLSTTPGRLRKVLADGPRPRSGFTPSRSRKNSAATIDKELANAAAAAVATLNIVPPVKGDAALEKPSHAALALKLKTAPALRSALETLDVDVPKTKMVSDITNAPRPTKTTLSSLPPLETTKAESAPTARKYKGGWLNRPARTTTSSKVTSTTTAPRRRVVDEPELGSGIVPRRLPLQYPRELS